MTLYLNKKWITPHWISIYSVPLLPFNLCYLISLKHWIPLLSNQQKYFRGKRNPSITVGVLSCWFFVTPWTVACQAPLSRGFPRQEYWSGFSFPPPGDLPDPGIESGLLHCMQILYQLNYEGRLFLQLYLYLNTEILNIYLFFFTSELIKHRVSEGGGMIAIQTWKVYLARWKLREKLDFMTSHLCWRRKRQPTPVLLPGESRGQGSLVGYGPWGHKESDTTEWLHFHFHSFV